jgi:hypothetical protein
MTCIFSGILVSCHLSRAIMVEVWLVDAWSMQIRATGGNCQCIHRNHGGLHTCTLQANSHIPCPAHATPLSCSDHAALKATSQGHDTARTGARHVHGMGTAWHVLIKIGRLWTACGRPAQVRPLPATTHSRRLLSRMLLFYVMCSIVLMTRKTADCKEYELNLRFKVSLPSVVMPCLHCLFFFWFYVGNNPLKFSNFEIPILNYWKRFCYFSDVQRVCEIIIIIIIIIISFETRYESSIFVLLAFLLPKECKAHMQLSSSPHNYTYWRLIYIKNQRDATWQYVYY